MITESISMSFGQTCRGLFAGETEDPGEDDQEPIAPTNQAGREPVPGSCVSAATGSSNPGRGVHKPSGKFVNLGTST